MPWSNAQLAALNQKGKNCLVNAGAGSGKTKVLTCKVTDLIAKGTDIDSILALTFTEAAASEMKSRIRMQLLEIDSTKAIADKIESAHIQTFDAFNLYLVKKYSSYLGLKKNISIMNSSLLEVKKTIFLKDIFDEYYEKEDETFVEMVQFYGAKTDDNLSKNIFQILNYSNLFEDKETFYQFLEDGCFNEAITNLIIDKRFNELKETLDIIIDATSYMENEEDAAQIVDFCQNLKAINDYDTMVETIPGLSFPRKKKADDKLYRDAIKNRFTLMFDKKLNFGTKKTIYKLRKSYQPYAVKFVETVKTLEKKITKYKEKCNAYTFNDIAFMALKLLKNKDIAREVSEQFDVILIDEYQDTSKVQEETISLISRDNVFMVGDVKQSIYRFRLADCMIFQNKYERFTDCIGGEKIDMNDNFRSKPEIVYDLNSLFGKLMDKHVNPIDFSRGHIATPGNKAYQQVEQDKGIIRYNYDYDKKDKDEYEARIIAQDIIKKVNEGFLVHKKVGDNLTLAKCDFTDFAIIMDREKLFDTYFRVFKEYKIPLIAYRNENITTSDIYLVFKNLINLLDLSIKESYEEDYKHSLASIYRSFLYRITDNELKDYLLESYVLNNPVSLIYEKNKYRLRDMSLKDMLLELLSLFNFDDKLITFGDYKANKERSNAFIDLASQMDELYMTLSEFNEFFILLGEKEYELTTSPIVDTDAAVRMLNIHKSKGLEFTICYFPGLYMDFNRTDLNQSFQVNDKYGLILKSPLYLNGVKDIFAHIYKNEEIIEDFSEKLRLFYVALSRARELAIIVEEESIKKIVLDLRFANNFHTMLKSINYNFRKEYHVEVLENIKLTLADEAKEVLPKLEIKSLKEPVKEILTKERASKAVVDATSDALNFGVELHEALELVDLIKKDTSFIKDQNIKRIIDRVLKLELFDNLLEAKVFKEYRLYDEDDQEMIIDLLIIYPTHADIIDYKTSNIYDVAYDKQLNKYKNALSKIYDKEIKMHLLSLVKGETREVK